MTSLAYGLGTASWDHYANGLIARQTLPNGAWTDYAYDGANRIRQLINKDPSGAVLAAYGDTEYLPTGDLAAWTAEVTGQANQSGAIAYDYDRKRRLIEETSTRLGGYDFDNAFDDAGNALEFRNDPHTYNADNQLVGPATYVYDGNGNPTTWDGTALTWNVENRMTGYGTALTAGYRGDGLRAWKQPGGGNQTYFLYDGISVLCELDHTGAVSASSTYGANGLLSRGTTQYQFDPLGDVVLLLDGTGAVTARQVFDGWGNALTAAVGPFGYRGRYGYYADSETGLVALAFRYYGPGVGRFLNRDPIGYRGGFGLYLYTHNGVLIGTDALGLFGGLPSLVMDVGYSLGYEICNLLCVAAKCKTSLRDFWYELLAAAARAALMSLLGHLVTEDLLDPLLGAIMGGFIGGGMGAIAQPPHAGMQERVVDAVIGLVTGAIIGFLGPGATLSWGLFFGALGFGCAFGLVACGAVCCRP